MAEDLRAAMVAAGIDPGAERLVADGAIHRFCGPGDKPGKKNCWYILFESGAGVFGSWRLGIEGTVASNGHGKLTKADKQRIKAAQAAAIEERNRLADHAASRAATIWAKATLIVSSEQHPYLLAKGIKPHGCRLLGNLLVVQVKNVKSGKLTSLQFVSPDGGKTYLKYGRTAEGYAAIADGTVDNPTEINVAEGYATACTVYEATGIPTTAAFSAGNLLAVAKGLHKKYPKARIVICSDNDRNTEGNPGVSKATEAVRAVRGSLAIPQFPDGVDGTDFNDLAASQGLDAVRQQIADARKNTNGDEENQVGIYRATKTGLVRIQTNAKGIEIEHPLTNYISRITADVTRDDGAETTRSFEILVTQAGRMATVTVSVAQFPTMRWAVEALGAEAVLYAGNGTADHARAAVQLLSGSPARRTVYAHTGWSKVGDDWVYLHTGGAIGAAGVIENVDVSLPPELAAFEIELPPDPAATRCSLEASLHLLDVGPDRITVPAYGAIWRAIIGGGTDFSLFLYGPTGVFKTELAALTQQHFGAGFNSRHLPTSFTSTANTNEALAFGAKDAVLVVDELHPPASGSEREAMHRDAARLLRAQGNGAGRGRMRPDGSLRPAKPPRGIMLATGEELPRGQSVHARLLNIEIGAGAIDAEKLSACQANAAAGLYAQATAVFIKYLAANFEEARAEFERLWRELRGQIHHEHARTADIRAQLTAAFSIFIAFLVQAEIIDDSQAGRLQNRVGAALEGVAKAQAQFSTAAEPVGAFIRLLTSAIASGRAHLANKGGGAPELCEAGCGWRKVTIGTGDYKRDEWQAQGDRVGWLDEEYVFLNRDAAYRAAQGMAAEGAGIEVSVTTLIRRLRDKRLLASVDSARETLTVRRVLEGRQHDVLHLPAKTLGLSMSLQPDISDRPDISELAAK